MLTGGKILKDKLILGTSSPSDAAIIRSGIAGNNNIIAIPPYGNHIIPTLEENNINLKKSSRQDFCYEEVRTIVRKILAFGKSDAKTAQNLVNEARAVLESEITEFFPNKTLVDVEIGFSYNWASIAIESEAFNSIFEHTKELFSSTVDGTYKLFSNNTDVISIHNYDMNGIYLNRAFFNGFLDILKRFGLITKVEIYPTVLKLLAFQVKSVALMEARKVGAGNLAASAELGQPASIQLMLSMLTLIAEGHKFSALTHKQQSLLKYAHTSNHGGPLGLGVEFFNLLKQFATDYAEEI